MLGHGNADPRVCVNNLLKTERYSVPFDRIKGLNTDFIDSPVAANNGDLIADAEWLIETYEPRAYVNSIDVGPVTYTGMYELDADISINTTGEDRSDV